MPTSENAGLAQGICKTRTTNTSGCGNLAQHSVPDPRTRDYKDKSRLEPRQRPRQIHAVANLNVGPACPGNMYIYMYINSQYSFAGYQPQTSSPTNNIPTHGPASQDSDIEKGRIKLASVDEGLLKLVVALDFDAPLSPSCRNMYACMQPWGSPPKR